MDKKKLRSAEKEPKCPKCRTKDIKNCHSMHCPMREKEPEVKEETQDELWDDVIRIVDSSRFSTGGERVRLLKKQFKIITRNP